MRCVSRLEAFRISTREAARRSGRPPGLALGTTMPDSIRCAVSGVTRPRTLTLERYEVQWPIGYVRAGLPAYLFLIAEREQINPPILKTSQQFVDDSRAKGNQADLKVFPGRTHHSNIRQIHEPGDEVFATVLDFVQRRSR